MPVTVACPSCGVKLNVPDNFLGKKVRCASCATVFEAKAEPPPQAHEERAPVEESIQQEILPEAPLDEPDERDDYEDDREDRRESRRRKRRRRDLEPHRGGLVLSLGITSAVMGVLGG